MRLFSCFVTNFLICSNKGCANVVVATAPKAAVTAVTITSAVGSGICISITGIFILGAGGCYVVFSSAFCVPAGRSKSAGGMTIGRNDGTLAEGGLKYISGMSKALGNLAEGISIYEGRIVIKCWR